ncbi:hypothetical protein C1645_731299 [Glomus cerebriforme]|uniref:F-box domain-containing protein n=1 Tax=Glomus cerebriforme TaxID=658196 RepID=A0A397TPV8_9GLOM|nr:hypothetical protein C1645_731299 [Glomus cerebriforme]
MDSKEILNFFDRKKLRIFIFSKQRIRIFIPYPCIICIICNSFHINVFDNKKINEGTNVKKFVVEYVGNEHFSSMLSFQHLKSQRPEPDRLGPLDSKVNHTWCKNGIIYLWKNPFRKEIDYNHTKIIPVLLSFLKKDENTLFDYPCFITHLDFDNLFRIASNFFNTNEDEVEYFLGLMEQDDTLPSIFSKLEYDKWPGFGQIWVIILLILVNMVKRKANIQWFKFDIRYNDIKGFLNNNREEMDGGVEYYYVDDERIVGSDVEMRYNIVNRIENIITTLLRLEDLDESKNFFENLEYLELDRSSFKIAILEAFSTCKNLKTIEIEHPYFQLILTPLVSLIKKQNNLENIIIYGVHNAYMIGYHEAIFEIISSLNTVVHSLKRIEICGIKMMNDETFKFIGKCKNLEILKLEDSYISIKNFEWIALAELPKLRSLELVYNWSNKEYVSQFNPIQMILQNKNISPNLKILHLLNTYIKNHDLLKSISENCRNLINFTTQLTADDDIQFLFTILGNNPNIKEFQLLNPGYPISTGFIINLVKALPKKTDYIRLVNIVSNVDEFREFLENCVVDLKFLYVVVSIQNNIDEFGECVKNWSEKRGKNIRKLDKFSIPSDKKILVRWE